MKEINSYKTEGIVFFVLAVLQVITAIICQSEELVWFSVILLLFATCSLLVAMVCFKHYEELKDQYNAKQSEEAWDSNVEAMYQKYLAEKDFKDYSGLQ